MKKESLITVDKVWGEEIWLVNRPEYCSKLLLIDRNAESSLHYHKTKQETFFAIEGYALLTIENNEYTLAPFTRAKTIFPGEKHKFKGITEAVIVEISTQHVEEDVVRLTKSIPGKSDAELAKEEAEKIENTTCSTES